MGLKSKLFKFSVIFICIYSIATIFFIPRNMVYVKMISLSQNIKDYPELKQLALEIVKPCQDYDRDLKYHCMYRMVADFVERNITYVPDSFLEEVLMLNNDPLHTLRYGGDCENKAILAIDLLKQLGFKNLYFVFQDDPDPFKTDHMCYMVYDMGRFVTYNCDPTKPISQVMQVV